MPKLKFQDPTGKEMTVEISEAFPEITIGRNPGNVIRINNPSISRSHAKIIYDGGRCTLFDLNSSNGSFVNGKKVRSQVLESGDRVRCGGFPLEFVDEEEDDFPTEAPVGAPPPLASPPLASPPPPIAPPPLSESLSQSPAVPPPLSQGASPVPGPPAFNMGAPGSSGSTGSAPVLGDFGGNSWGSESSPSIESLSPSGSGVFPPPPVQPSSLPPSLSPPPPSSSGLAAAPSELEVLRNELEQMRVAKIEAESSIVELERQLQSMAMSVSEGGVESAALEALRQERDQLARELESARSVTGHSNDGASALKIEKLSKDRERLHEERRNLMRQISDLKRSLEDVPDPEEIAALREGLESVTAERDELAQQREALEGEVAQRDAEIGQLQADIEAVNQHLAQLTEEHQALEHEFAAASEAHEALRLQAENFNAEIESRDNQIAECVDAIEQLQAEVGDLTQERDALQQSVDALRANLGDAPTHELVQSLNDEVAQLREELEAVTGERDHLSDDAQQHHERVEGLTQERDEALAELEKANQLKDRYQSEREEFRQARDAFYRENENLQAERKRLEEEVEKGQKSQSRNKAIFAELAGDLKGLVAANSRLTEENKALKAQGASLSANTEELLELREKLHNTEAELGQARGEVARLNEAVEASQGDHEAMAEKVVALEAENQQLTEALNAAERGAGEGGDPDVEVLAEKVVDLERELEQVRVALGNERKNTEDLVAEIERLTVDAQSSHSNGVADPSDGALQAELEQLQSALSEAIDERDRLERRLHAVGAFDIEN